MFSSTSFLIPLCMQKCFESKVSQIQHFFRLACVQNLFLCLYVRKNSNFLYLKITQNQQFFSDLHFFQHFFPIPLCLEIVKFLNFKFQQI